MFLGNLFSYNNHSNIYFNSQLQTISTSEGVGNLNTPTWMQWITDLILRKDSIFSFTATNNTNVIPSSEDFVYYAHGQVISPPIFEDKQEEKEQIINDLLESSIGRFIQELCHWLIENKISNTELEINPLDDLIERLKLGKTCHGEAIAIMRSRQSKNRPIHSEYTERLEAFSMQSLHFFRVRLTNKIVELQKQKQEIQLPLCEAIKEGLDLKIKIKTQKYAQKSQLENGITEKLNSQQTNDIRKLKSKMKELKLKIEEIRSIVNEIERKQKSLEAKQTELRLLRKNSFKSKQSLASLTLSNEKGLPHKQIETSLLDMFKDKMVTNILISTESNFNDSGHAFLIQPHYQRLYDSNDGLLQYESLADMAKDIADIVVFDRIDYLKLRLYAS